MTYVIVGVILLFMFICILLAVGSGGADAETKSESRSGEDYFWGVHWSEVPVEHCRRKLNELEHEFRQTKSVPAFNALVKLLDSHRRHLDRIVERRNTSGCYEQPNLLYRAGDGRAYGRTSEEAA